MNRVLGFTLRILVLSVTLLAGIAVQARAQITFSGTTSFQFNGAGGFGSTSSLGGLTLRNTGFSTTTDSFTGMGNVGGATSNFGRVSLTNQTFIYSGNSVSLRVAFTAPTVASQTFSGTLFGRVANTTQGGLSIIWNPGVIRNIAFANGPGAGMLSLWVNNIDVTPGQVDQAISGRIFAEIEPDVTVPALTAPEPASVVLMATGLVGIVCVARRRRRSAVR